MIAASGPLRAGAIRTEYGGTGATRLSHYYRGAVQGWVKNKAANNNAVNMSAAVPVVGTAMRLSVFRGQGKGFTFTNSTVRAPATHYHCHAEFGDDWASNSWPCFYINNNTLGAGAAGMYALVIYGRAVGPFTFTNNAEIQGYGGAANSGAGMHAVYIYNTVGGANRPIFVNGINGKVRGGGGGGGKGGTGGRGGATHYLIYEPGSPAQTSTSYARNSTTWKITGAPVYSLIWGGTTVYSAGSSPSNGQNIGGIAYWTDSVLRETYAEGPYNVNGYGLRRTIGADSGAGGLGGAGGNGGAGQGYNNITQDAGVAGANGAAGAAAGNWGSMTGSGGKGGTGGTGGIWGSAGATGNVGATGNSGSSPVPPQATAGAAGVAGGAAGYAIYAAASSPWGFTNSGTINGSTGGGTAPT